MRRIRVAVGSNDGQNVVRDHMGEAKNFYLFDVSEDGTYTQVDIRKNTSPEEKRHGLDEKRVSVMEILSDTDVLVGGHLSPNFIKLRDRTRFQPLISKVPSIDDSMKVLIQRFERVFALVEARRRGERPKEIPVLEA